jgi:hypothetical protein
VRKAYLGTSEGLTLEKLFSAARSLADKLPGGSQDTSPTNAQAAYDAVANIERALRQRGRLGRKDSERLIALARWALGAPLAFESAQSHDSASP